MPPVKPLIIGQAPARGNDGKPPFSGRSGARLAELIGVTKNGLYTGDVLPEYFDLVNLLPAWQGKQGKGDVFDMKTAKLKAGILIHELNEGPPRSILMMGRKVRRAMGVNGDWEYLEWFDFYKHEAVIFPHPSGVNRWWNDQANYGEARFFLRDVIWGSS